MGHGIEFECIFFSYEQKEIAVNVFFKDETNLMFFSKMRQTKFFNYLQPNFIMKKLKKQYGSINSIGYFKQNTSLEHLDSSLQIQISFKYLNHGNS